MASIVTVALANVTALTVTTVQSVRGLDSAAAAEDRRHLRALCSPACQDGCPNVVDLYATLAAGEGVSLPALCDDVQRIAGSGYRRMMAEMSPLGAPAAAPVVAAAAPM